MKIREVCLTILLSIGVTFNVFASQTDKNTEKTDMNQTYYRSTPIITLSAAQKILSAGKNLAESENLNLAIAVVDSSGNLIAFLRMDKARPVTIDVAIGKAKTAAYLGAPSKKFEDMINNGFPSMLSTPGLTPLQGGEPIVCNDLICGAVGVSGSNGETDRKIAQTLAVDILTHPPD
nr:heme-binding protein [uncultured Desulfobacter sp.]